MQLKNSNQNNRRKIAKKFNLLRTNQIGFNEKITHQTERLHILLDASWFVLLLLLLCECHFDDIQDNNNTYWIKKCPEKTPKK